MNFGCHRSERARQFKNSNYVSHVPKSRLRKTDADQCILKYESYFNRLVEKNFDKGLSTGAKGYINLRENHQDTRVEISGNSQSGTILLKSGLSRYSEIHYSPRAIHVYHYEGGNRGQEAAIYLNRQLPTESYSFGVSHEVQKLLKSV